MDSKRLSWRSSSRSLNSLCLLRGAFTLSKLVSRLGRLTVLGQVLCWHQDPQNVLTALALGQQLRDQLEQTPQRVPSYRSNLLSDGDGALCERKPFRFRPRSRCLLEQRLRYATQPEVALDRFLLAHLSRLQATHLLAELMKDFRGPPITPGLDHTPTFPIQCVGEEKAGRIPEVLLFMHDDQPLAPIAFESYHLRKRPKRLCLPIATAHPQGTKTFRMRLP